MNTFLESSAPVPSVFIKHVNDHIQILSKSIYSWAGDCSFGPMLADKTPYSYTRNISPVRLNYFLALLFSIPIGYAKKDSEENHILMQAGSSLQGRV